MPLNFNSNNVSSVNFNGTPVTKINFNGVEIWSSSPAPTLLEPFYIENPSSEDSISIQLRTKGTAPSVTLESSTDKNTWTAFSVDTNYTIPASGKLYIRCPENYQNNSFGTSKNNYYTFSSASHYNAGGDITTLLEKDGAVADLSVSPYDSGWTFNGLFRDYDSNTPATLSSITNLVLPSTTIGAYCYYNLFRNCNLLTSVPNNLISATTLAYQCCAYMFYGCGGLTTPPSLPATTLAELCYWEMFYNSGVTSIASLSHVTQMGEGSCKQMYSNCSGLVSVSSVLPGASVPLANSCYYGMFANCSNLTGCPSLPATTLAMWCYQQMFSNCASLVNGPDLMATTLVGSCYKEMFSHSYSLTNIKVNCSDWGTSNEFYNWMNGINTSGTFYCPTALGDDSTITRGASNCPPGWTVINTD